MRLLALRGLVHIEKNEKMTVLYFKMPEDFTVVEGGERNRDWNIPAPSMRVRLTSSSWGLLCHP